MKKLLIIIMAAGIFTACSEKATEPEKPEEETQQVETNTNESEVNQIDTSVYEYASNVDVTDVRDINNHITLMIDMKTDNPGMAFQHVLNQTYDFLQQSDIEGAETIGINVRVAGNKVGMFTAYPDKFIPNDDEPMSDAVLAASEIEMMTEDVGKFGETMGWGKGN